MAMQLEEIDAIAEQPRARRPSRTPSSAMERRRARPRPGVHLLGHLEREPLDAGVPGDPAGDGAEAVGVPVEDHAEPGALRAHQGGLRGDEMKRCDRPAAPRLAGLRRLRAQRRHPGGRGEGALRRDQQAARRAAHQFGNNVLADEEGYVTYITEDQLSGLPDSFVQAAAAAATERDHEGEYAITNTRSSMDPFLTFSDERDLREKVWRTYYSAATTATSTTTTRSSPRSCSCGRARASCWATTTTPSGGSRTAWPRPPSARSS